jgi:flagellar biosynthesis/type III secretory pathway protein FliH
MDEIAELEDMPMLEETLIEWQEQVREQGREEGMERGQLAGMRRMLLRLLERRFGQLPQKVRQSVEALASVEEIERLEDRALEARSIFEIGLA